MFNDFLDYFFFKFKSFECDFAPLFFFPREILIQSWSLQPAHIFMPTVAPALRFCRWCPRNATRKCTLDGHSRDTGTRWR